MGITNCCASPLTSPNYGVCLTSDDFNCPDGNKILCTNENCAGVNQDAVLCNFVLGRRSTATNRWGSLFCTDYRCSAINIAFCYSVGNSSTAWKACDTSFCDHTWPPSKSPSSGGGGGPKPGPSPSTTTSTSNPSYGPTREPTFVPSGAPSPYPTKVGTVTTANLT